MFTLPSKKFVFQERELIPWISQLRMLGRKQDLIDALEHPAKSTIHARTEKASTDNPALKTAPIVIEKARFHLRSGDPCSTDEVAADSTSQENPVENRQISAIKFAERKTAVYDELDHPELIRLV